MYQLEVAASLAALRRSDRLSVCHLLQRDAFFVVGHESPSSGNGMGEYEIDGARIAATTNARTPALTEP